MAKAFIVDEKTNMVMLEKVEKHNAPMYHRKFRLGKFYLMSRDKNGVLHDINPYEQKPITIYPIKVKTIVSKWSSEYPKED